MAFADDMAMVEGTDESYESPNSFEEAWDRPGEEDRENGRTTIRTEFNDMIDRQVVWRQTKTYNIPKDRRLIGSK